MRGYLWWDSLCTHPLQAPSFHQGEWISYYDRPSMFHRRQLLLLKRLQKIIGAKTSVTKGSHPPTPPIEVTHEPTVDEQHCVWYLAGQDITEYLQWCMIHKNFEAKSLGIPHIWTFANISCNSLEKYTQSSQSKSQTFYQWVYMRAVQVRWQVVQSCCHELPLP